jgi:hypothetical protein
MALDLALARFALRRLSDDVPPQPTLNGNDRRAFAEVAVMLDPRTLTDADLAAIAGAIDRGRERVKTIADNGGAGEAVAAAAGLSGWRLQAFEWRRAHEPDRVLPLFSLGDLLRLGDPDPALVARLDLWGTSAVSATGCLCLRFPPRVGTDAYEGRQDAGLWAGFTPDVTLRVVELMHRLKLPAALLPGVLQSVLQSYVESAATAYHGDWMRMIAQAQALTEERLADHVAALTAVGALVAR